jgi:nucleotide-binding universal stress UspA family protein
MPKSRSEERTMVESILVAVDNSRVSEAAFKQALVLASSMRARLVAVGVTPKYEGNMNRLKIVDLNTQLSAPFRKSLEDAASYAASLGQEIRTVHRIGEPSEEIVRVAEEEGADLVVLGNAKRSAVEKVLLGRKTAKVIAGSPCDVLLVPEMAEVRFGKILIGINGTPASSAAGSRALELAVSYGSEVHAVTAIDIPSDRRLRYGVLKDARQKGFKALEAVARQGERLGVQVFTELQETTPEKCLIEYARKKDIHHIILGSKGYFGVSDILLGSVVDRVAVQAPCPVQVVKKAG